MKAKRKMYKEEEKAWLQTDLITDFKWCSVLIVSSLLKLLVSQICIVHSSVGDALKYTHKCEKYYMSNKICIKVLKTWLLLNPNESEQISVPVEFLLHTSIPSLKEIAQYMLTY